MANVVRMPRMSDTMEAGNIVEWHVKVGDTVEAGDLLAEIETDKATMEFESLWDGTILHIEVHEGEVPVNGVIAVLGEEGEDWKAAIAAEEGASEEKASENGTAKAEEASVASAAPAAASSNGASTETRVKASPLAKSIAKDAGVDIATIAGSGPEGRIVKKDVESFLKQDSPAPAPAVAAPAPSPTPATPVPAKKEAPAAPAIPAFTYGGGGDNFENVPLSQMRKVIARRLGESKFSAPHFYLTVEINMGKVMKLRKDLNAVAPTKLSFNDLVVKAVAVGLRSHPMINASWQEDHIRINKDVNIGVAVAVEEGLLVPVIRYADIKTLSQINTEVRELAGKARNRKLQPQEMSGSTFTISNLGMFGIEEFTAIINPPDACILAVGGIVQKPIVEDGRIVPGNMMKVTMSCDHRVVDGATGAQFLKTLKGILEEPIKLLV